MGSFQELVGQVGKGVKIAVDFISQAASRLLTTASEKTEALSSKDMSRLVDCASEALQGRVEPTSGAATTVQKTPLEIAQAMLDSYQFDKKTGVSTFIVPAGVTDVEAMRALNEYFRKQFPLKNRDAIFAGDLDYYETLPNFYRPYCQERDYSHARQIKIAGVVKGTEDGDRNLQGSVLTAASLVFSDPRDQAIAAALHACKYQGEDLFEDFFVCGSVPGLAMGTLCFHGVFVDYPAEAKRIGRRLAASGSPSPELTVDRAPRSA